MPRAVVVGAGISGLAIAGALARAEWQVTLLERAERIRADNAALLIWPNGVAALHRLGLGGGLDAIASQVPSGGIRRPDGGWLVRPEDQDLPAEMPYVVHREDLHDALFAGLGDKVEIRTGVGIRTVRQPTVGTRAASGTGTQSNGQPSAGSAGSGSAGSGSAGSGPAGSGDSVGGNMPGVDDPAVSDGIATWEADVVIGADGVDSVVRRRLAPDATMISAGCTAWRAVIPWYNAADLIDKIDRLPTADRSGETIGAGHRFRYAVMGHRGSAGSSSRGGIYWAATVPGAARPEAPTAQLALLRRWFADWHAPIHDLIAATEPDDLIQHPIGELWPIPSAFSYRTGSGGYALVGDAAHAMAHHLGHGACLALEDAASLVDKISGSEPGPALQAALTAYSQARRGQVVRIGRQSRRVSAVLASSRASSRTRDAALGLAPGPLTRASHALRHFRRS